jgi:hypothetical protein
MLPHICLRLFHNAHESFTLPTQLVKLVDTCNVLFLEGTKRDSRPEFENVFSIVPLWLKGGGTE